MINRSSGLSLKVGSWRLILAIVALVLTAPVGAAEVTVYAAASLGNAFRDVARIYQVQQPDVDVVFSFAASDVLQRQIVNGAPADIFASADQIAMDKAEQEDVIQAETRKDFARNSLVLITPIDDDVIQGLADLDSSAISRIALGNPDTVPAGRYAQAGLRQAGAWEVVQGKQILGQNVRQVLDYVARGEVDAGFVFATDAASMPDQVRVVETLSSPTPVLYPLALVKRDGHSEEEEARGFYDFILSDAGQRILQKYGFDEP